MYISTKKVRTFYIKSERYTLRNPKMKSERCTLRNSKMNIDFIQDVLEDIQSMVGIARREADQGGSSGISGSRNEISKAEIRYQAAEMRCGTMRTRYFSNNMISGPVK